MVKQRAVGWYPDRRVQGLAVWVKAPGRAVWALDYRYHGRQRRMTLGRVPTMRPREAVKLAIKHRAAIADGHDPLAEKESARRADAANVTLREFFEQWVREVGQPTLRPRTLAEDRKMFAHDIAPILGAVRVADLDERDVARLHRLITARPAPVQANRVVARLSAMMTAAARWRLRPPHSNPCTYVARNREEKRHRFLTGQQLVALGQALAESATAPVGSAAWESPTVLSAIQLIAFTGCRRSEVLTLRWADVNLEAGVLDLPTSKTGRKVVVLNAQARQVLAGVPRVGDYVFPGRWNHPHTGLGRAWGRIRRRAGLEGVRLHDLRHTFASTAAGLGASLPVIGDLLGQAEPSTTQRYAGLTQDVRQATSDAVGERLASFLTPPATPAAVVPIGRRRRRG